MTGVVNYSSPVVFMGIDLVAWVTGCLSAQSYHGGAIYQGHLRIKCPFTYSVAGGLGMLGTPEGSTWHSARGGSGHVLL